MHSRWLSVLSVSLFLTTSLPARAPYARAETSPTWAIDPSNTTSSDSLQALHDKQAPCPCPEISNDWELAPDTMNVPCSLFSLAPVPIQRLIICSHGLFLGFEAEEEGEGAKSHHAWWFAFVPPTRERYRPYVENGEVGKDLVLVTPLDANVIKDKGTYGDLRRGMKEILGNLYEEGRIIHFDRTHMPKPTLLLRDRMKIEWKGRSIEFRMIPELYYRRNSFKGN